MREIHVGKNESNQRADKLLKKLLPQAGSGFIYKMLRKKNITLNDKKCAGGELLKEGDVIKLWLAEDTINKFSTEQQRPKCNVKLKPVYEDEDIIIFNKPAGLLSQKAREDDESVNDALIDYLFTTGQLTLEDMATFKPSICNRLDRNTSGLVICGKSLYGLQTIAKA